MKRSDYLNTHEGLLLERKYSRLALVGLAIALILALTLAVSKRETVVMVPPGLSATGQIDPDSANAAVKEAWGAYVAGTIGNVTPTTADFVAKQLGSIIAPVAYKELNAAIGNQTELIKGQHVSLQFSPNSVFYDAPSDKVIVSGEYRILGVRSDSVKASVRTYEIGVAIRNYHVAITSLMIYEGAWKPNQQDS